MLIIRGLNCIDAASGIVTLIKWLSDAQVGKDNSLSQPVRRTATYFQSDDTRCCINTIHPPDDEHIMLETCRGS